MAKTPARRLKVFQAQFGFYDSVVAAPSQPAALRAWGTRQNLFADGRASITKDAQAADLALAHPETPLRRAIGSTDPFALEPTSLPTVPDPPKKAAKPAHLTANSKPAPSARPQPSRPVADRSALAKAEASLARLDAARMREEADLRRRQSELDSRRETAQGTYVEKRKTATAAVVAARQAYRKAGGTD